MSFGFKELAIVLIIVLLVFGSKKLKSLGRDLGSAIKGFKSAIKSDDAEETTSNAPSDMSSDTEVDVTPTDKSKTGDKTMPPQG